MSVRRSVVALAAGLLLVGIGSAGAAPECKEVFVGRSRVSDPINVRAIEKTAIDGAIAHWRQQVRHSYGWPYRYWTAARNKLVRCTGSASTRVCSASARPCKRVS